MRIDLTPISQPAAAASPAACFHCGLPILAGALFGVHIEGQWRAMCCPGCEAVAQAIAGRGLSDYYRLRDAVSGRMASTSADDRLPDDLSVYDSLALQSRFVREVAPEHVPDAAGPGPVRGRAKAPWRARANAHGWPRLVKLAAPFRAALRRPHAD